jgi:formate dehydrogenase subunit beta
MSTSVFWAAELKNARTTFAAFLGDLLARDIVDAVYVPLRTAGGEAVAPALVSKAELLAQADPLAPVMLINGARAVAALTVGGAAGRIAAVLRSCEIRALIELAKLKQANLERVTIIGVDCAGTYEVGDYARSQADGADQAARLLAEAAEGHIRPHDGFALRPACRMCEFPVPAHAQMTVGFIGVDGLMIAMDEETATRLELAWPRIPEGDLAFRQDIIQRLVATRTEQRDAAMADFGKRMADPAALASYFAACQRCHNCMVACPICYCKECLFRTAALEHDPAQYLRSAVRKGATRLPADTVLFHLTRLNHMSTSCVGCGMCESACPSNIPLTALFRTVSAHTQALFEYVPGRRLDEEIPLMTFREAELEGV